MAIFQVVPFFLAAQISAGTVGYKQGNLEVWWPEPLEVCWGMVVEKHKIRWMELECAQVDGRMVTFQVRGAFAI